jgi:hypothetical protein
MTLATFAAEDGFLVQLPKNVGFARELWLGKGMFPHCLQYLFFAFPCSQAPYAAKHSRHCRFCLPCSQMLLP